MFETAYSMIVFAPHADDESLGCGGLPLRYLGRQTRSVLTLVRVTGPWCLKGIFHVPDPVSDPPQSLYVHRHEWRTRR
jgi:hypothetical protein